MTVLQNFSTPAGNDDTIALQISGVNLTGATIYWNVYAQEFGVPLPSATPLLTKVSSDSTEINAGTLPYPTMFLQHGDTLGMLGNYYFEVTVIDNLGDYSLVTQGMMTVTQAEVIP